MKELTDIQTKGCPDGIEAIDVSGMDTWVFGVAVLGDETVYRVCSFLCRLGSDFESASLVAHALPNGGVPSPLTAAEW